MDNIAQETGSHLYLKPAGIVAASQASNEDRLQDRTMKRTKSCAPMP
ncbi:MAG: hypothetical protein KGJ82_12190 [Nitrospirota bacterium]|nr:hypothetical protein [Nitrospirota bacterium]